MLNKSQRVLIAISLATMLGSGSVLADVKIGFLGGFTGPIESMTPGIVAAAKLAVAQVNAQGGVLNGQKIIMPQADTTCVDATAGANAADRLVNSEQVLALVGPLCSGVTISAANNVAIPAGVVIISPASTSPALTTLKDRDLVFRTTPSDAYQGAVMARLLKSKGIHDIAITYLNNDYGKGLSSALAKNFKAIGGKVVANEAHEDGRSDYRAELGSLASAGSQNLVVLALADGSGQTILRQAVESGDFTQFIGGDGMVSNSLIKAVGADNLKTMIGTKPGTPNIAGAGIYGKAARAAGQDPNAVFGAQAYDAAFLLALAVEKNGNNHREGLSKALRAIASAPGEVILPGEWKKAKALLKAGKDINYEGATGSLEFDAAGDVPGVIVEMAIKDGEFKIVKQLK